MSRYVAAQFDTGIKEKVYQILSDNEFPKASFYYSVEEFCYAEGIPCSTCGVIMEEEISNMENNKSTSAYVFIETPKEKCTKLVQDLIEAEQIDLVLFAKCWKSLLMDCIKVKCNECLGMITQNIDRFNAQVTKTVPDKFTVPKDFFNNDEQEGDPLMNLFRVFKTPTKPQAAPNSPHTGFVEMNSMNEEYHWTKCRLCMRILRTKRADPSRMRTLQTSHARNHVSQMQYSCLLCTFTCRFHGGIQLHMTRTHPEAPFSSFLDRSREQGFKKEIADMVITCFGSDVQPSRGLRSEMF